MGEAREVLDRLTEAVFSKDWETLEGLYAPDVVAVTPDQGEIRGASDVAGWSKQFLDGFPDARYEPAQSFESGDTAIDEGYLVATNTGPLVGPTGEEMPATGKSIRMRACDIATVEDGAVTSHRFYFDQAEFMSQLGLMEEPSGASA